MKILALVEVRMWRATGSLNYFAKDGDEVERHRAAEDSKLVKGWANKLAQCAEKTEPPQYDFGWDSSVADRYKELVARRNGGDVGDFVRTEEVSAGDCRRSPGRNLTPNSPQRDQSRSRKSLRVGYDHVCCQTL
jgi:hypothetical protein